LNQIQQSMKFNKGLRWAQYGMTAVSQQVLSP